MRKPLAARRSGTRHAAPFAADSTAPGGCRGDGIPCGVRSVVHSVAAGCGTGLEFDRRRAACGAVGNVVRRRFVYVGRTIDARVSGRAARCSPAVCLLDLSARTPPAEAPRSIAVRSGNHGEEHARAGQTLDQAIVPLGDHSPEPLAKEFRWCAKQMGMGLALPAVMRSLMQRVRLYDLRIIATALIVHRHTGGNVVLVLERLVR